MLGFPFSLLYVGIYKLTHLVHRENEISGELQYARYKFVVWLCANSEPDVQMMMIFRDGQCSCLWMNANIPL